MSQEPVDSSWASAIASAYAKYREASIKLGVSLLKDESTAEDICHNVFLRLMRRSDQPTTLTLQYILTAIRNECLTWLRHAARHRSAEPEYLDQIPQPEKDHGLELPYHALQRWKAELPEQQRIVFDLWCQRFSYEEIGDLLQIAYSTVKTQLTRAKATIRKRAEQEMAREREREKGLRLHLPATLHFESSCLPPRPAIGFYPPSQQPPLCSIAPTLIAIIFLA